MQREYTILERKSGFLWLLIDFLLSYRFISSILVQKFKVPKGIINEKCSATDLCNDLVGLACQDGVCKCASNSYWKENKCGKDLNNAFHFYQKYRTNDI